MSNVSMIDGHIDNVTDNEIIKALERCNKPIGKAECTECPYFKTNGSCSEKLINDAIDLINRQNAEIERYKGVIKILENDVATATSKAIKEFAERLKSKFAHSGKSTKYGDFTWGDITSYELDNLVKEMAGETK